MKRNRTRGRAYSKLIHRIFLQTLLLFFASIVIVYAIRSAGRGTFGNLIVRGFQSLFGLGWREAAGMYQVLVRNNLDTIMMLTVIMLLFVFFRFYLTWFTRYFDEIAAGVESLAADPPEKIVMSPELDYMQEKLGQVKDRLEARAREAREAEQRKNDLVVYLAHDIKTPLTSVMGYLSLLDETPDMPAPQREKYTRIALQKAERLEALIGDFFEITRDNLQTLPFKKEPIDLCYMLVQMADEAYPQLAASGKTVEVDVPEELTLCGDSDKLARVFNNILKNAVAYGKAGSAVVISAAAGADSVVVTFRSAGTIPPDKLEVIFEKFYRLDAARSTGTGGAGLGLAIARDIVALHGGTVTARNDGPDAVFTITLPNSPPS